jgi:hypothetical protein
MFAKKTRNYGIAMQGSRSSPAAFPPRRRFDGAIKLVMVSFQARSEKTKITQCAARKRLAPLEEPQGRRAGPALPLLHRRADERCGLIVVRVRMPSDRRRNLIAPSRGRKDADHKSGGPRYLLFERALISHKSLREIADPSNWVCTAREPHKTLYSIQDGLNL